MSESGSTARDQPKGPSADRPCPVSWSFCRNNSAVSGTAQAFLFLFRLISNYGIKPVRARESKLASVKLFTICGGIISFYNFDQRDFMSPSGIPGDVQDHIVKSF